MATKMSQKEYLKKYLSGDKKKKKKDKKLKAKATVKIIDDDVHGSNNLEIDEELLLTGEDAPQIVGVVDAFGETPENKWKSIGGIKKEEKSDDDLWGKKAATTDKSNEDRPQIKKKTSRATDQSPPRNVKSALPSRRSSDQSPPRKGRIRGERVNEHNSIGEKRSRWNSDMPPARDQSPSRKQSPIRPRRDSDQSPPRKRSPIKSRRDSDQSPPRRRSPTQSRRDSDQSPRRRRSPTRLRRDSDQSPRRRRSPAHSKRNSDQSPPRRRSPDRKKRDTDHSPIRRHTAKNSDHLSNSSSRIRIKRENSSDQSPPRRPSNGNPFKTSIKVENSSPGRRTDSISNQERRNGGSESPPPTHKPSSSSKMSRTLDGKRAGLQDAQTLKIETEERRRNEELMFSNMSKEISGRDAEVQVRKNSSYRRRRKDDEEDPEVQRKKAEHEEKKKELYSRWNKGVKQIEAFKAKISDEQYEGSKPLARYSNDEDLDEMLKQKEREDDPMLEYIRSKKKDQQLAANIPVMPKYKGSYPENRFGIPPGYRWDGVDRSNGYEQKWFDVQNAKVAGAEEAYKYSVEDM